MDGVTILETFEKHLVPIGGIIFLCIFGICIFTLSTLVLFFEFDKDTQKYRRRKVRIIDKALCIIMAIVMIAYISFFVWLYNVQPDVYKMTISDDVSFVEFNEKYDILEEYDDCYLVYEKQQIE